LKNKHLLLLFASLAPASAEIVERGSVLEVRLRQPVASYSSRAGQPLTADLVSPVRDGGETLLSQGCVLRGRLTEVHRVGWGLKAQRASLRVDFDELELPDGTVRPVKTRLRAVDNARETVDATGKVVGIRAVSPLGPHIAGITRYLMVWDPLFQATLAASTLVMFRMPETEIHFPAGTDLLVELTEPVELGGVVPAAWPKVSLSDSEEAALAGIVRDMTWRTLRKGNGKSGDIVNIVLLGDPAWVERAFAAAGFSEAVRMTPISGFTTFRYFGGARDFPEAPMTSMVLDGHRPQYQYSKGLNSVSKRHHIRIFSQQATWNGHPIYAASATHDVAVTMSLRTSFLYHLVDRRIDNERAKIVNDLIYTGCVDAGQFLNRPWVPRQTVNGMGEALETDGAVVVLELNPCRTPLHAAARGEDEIQVTGSAFQRFMREIFTTASGDATVNNPIYQASLGLKHLFRRNKGREPDPLPGRPVVQMHSPSAGEVEISTQ
jgi:hypothetical protein